MRAPAPRCAPRKAPERGRQVSGRSRRMCVTNGPVRPWRPSPSSAGPGTPACLSLRPLGPQARPRDGVRGVAPAPWIGWPSAKQPCRCGALPRKPRPCPWSRVVALDEVPGVPVAVRSEPGRVSPAGGRLNQPPGRRTTLGSCPPRRHRPTRWRRSRRPPGAHPLGADSPAPAAGPDRRRPGIRERSRRARNARCRGCSKGREWAGCPMGAQPACGASRRSRAGLARRPASTAALPPPRWWRTAPSPPFARGVRVPLPGPPRPAGPCGAPLSGPRRPRRPGPRDRRPRPQRSRSPPALGGPGARAGLVPVSPRRSWWAEVQPQPGGGLLAARGQEMPRALQQGAGHPGHPARPGGPGRPDDPGTRPRIPGSPVAGPPSASAGTVGGGSAWRRRPPGSGGARFRARDPRQRADASRAPPPLILIRYRPWGQGYTPRSSARRGKRPTRARRRPSSGAVLVQVLPRSRPPPLGLIHPCGPRPRSAADP